MHMLYNILYMLQAHTCAKLVSDSITTVDQSWCKHPITSASQDIVTTKLCSRAAEVQKAVLSQAVTTTVCTEKRSTASYTLQM